MWCPRTESNRGPIDYKSIALPAELQGLLFSCLIFSSKGQINQCKKSQVSSQFVDCARSNVTGCRPFVTDLSLNDIGLHPIIVLTHTKFDDVEFEIRNKRYKTLIADTSDYKKLNALISQSLEKFDATIIDPIKIFCNDEEKYCSAYNQNYKKMIIWYDGSHLSFFGAKLVSKEIINIINFNN